MKNTRDKFKQRMRDINKRISFLWSVEDITGGERGMRRQDKNWREVKKLKKELMILNRKLLKA